MGRIKEVRVDRDGEDAAVDEVSPKQGSNKASPMYYHARFSEMDIC